MKIITLGTICLALGGVALPCSAQTANSPQAQDAQPQPSAAGPQVPSSPAVPETGPAEISHEAMVEEQERRDREEQAERDRDDRT